MDATTRTAPAEPVLYRPEPVAPLVPAVTLPYLSPVPVQGAVEAQTPDGHRVWLLLSRIEPTGPAAPGAPSPPAVPTWAKTTAVLSLALSGSSVLAAYALNLFAEGLAELVAALVLLAKFAFVLVLVLGLVVIVAAVTRRKTDDGSVTASATSTATARGFLAKATATATATASK
ncbi:hypothetical protein ACFRKD_26910 [Streptomyces niveus]|uniref:hypothetical protein n=1 Tax=Streptomyces niveus TaxID=193462 RepID=UPI0036A74DB0